MLRYPNSLIIFTVFLLSSVVIAEVNGKFSVNEYWFSADPEKAADTRETVTMSRFIYDLRTNDGTRSTENKMIEESQIAAREYAKKVCSINNKGSDVFHDFTFDRAPFVKVEVTNFEKGEDNYSALTTFPILVHDTTTANYALRAQLTVSCDTNPPEQTKIERLKQLSNELMEVLGELNRLCVVDEFGTLREAKNRLEEIQEEISRLNPQLHAE